jgi:hypothetical protein
MASTRMFRIVISHDQTHKKTLQNHNFFPLGSHKKIAKFYGDVTLVYLLNVFTICSESLLKMQVMSLEYIHPTVQIRYEEAGGWVTGMPSLGLTIAPTSKPDYSKLLSGQDDGPVYTMLSCLPKSVVKKCSLIHPPSDCTPKPAFSTNNHQESLAKKSTRHNSSSNGRHEAL